MLSLASLAIMLFVSDRVIGALNLFGVGYAAESHRYRTQLTRLVFQRADGSLDLDGELFRQLPSVTHEFSDFSVRINSLGFRGPEIAAVKPPGVYRILALGDSVTFGWGIDDGDTFVRRLEGELNRQIGGRRFEVINTGHPMYDTVQEAALFERVGLALDPDLVLLTYVINDIDPSRDIVERYLADSQRAAREPGFVPARASTLASLLPSLATLYRYGATRLSGPAGPVDEALMQDFVQGRQRGWERSTVALLKIRDLCAGKGIPLLVLDNTHPPIGELPGFCQANGISCFDLKFTAAERLLPIQNSMLDAHNNRRGNELLLDKLKRALRAAGLFDLR